VTIQDFQRSHGLIADGIAGKATVAMLEKAVYFPQRPPFPLLTQDQRITYFGDPRGQKAVVTQAGNFAPDHGWQARSIIQILGHDLAPWPHGWAMTHGIPMHHRVVPHFLRMWGLWRAAGLFRCLHTWNGSTVYRLSRSGSGRLSAHAFGIAFDINAKFNAYGQRAADVGEPGSCMELVTIAHACGFFWGGHFSTGDGMHFEYADLSQLEP